MKNTLFFLSWTLHKAKGILPQNCRKNQYFLNFFQRINNYTYTIEVIYTCKKVITVHTGLYGFRCFGGIIIYPVQYLLKKEERFVVVIGEVFLLYIDDVQRISHQSYGGFYAYYARVGQKFNWIFKSYFNISDFPPMNYVFSHW